MALINCPDCGRRISDTAAACPGCARPIAAQAIEVTTLPKGVQAIEATGKKWKALQIIGVFLILIGMVSCIASFSSAQAGEDHSAFPIIIFLLGLGGYIYGRFGAWWHHK